MANSGLVVNEGTQTAVAVDTVGTLDYGVVKLDMGATGTTNPFTGTITEIANLAKGTITSLQGGTVATNVLSGSIAVTAGTISVLPNTPGGTIGLVTRVGNIGTLEVGTISVLPNLPQGSINVTAGTVGGAAATAVALSGNPIPVGGVDAGGTVYGLLVDTAGKPQVNIIAGTVTNVGTIANIGVVHNAGTIAALPNIPGGTIGVVSSLTAGTVTRVGNVGTLEVGTISAMPNVPGGTLNLVTTVTNLSNGTIQSSGTVTGVGVVSLLSAGTITSVQGGTIGLVSNLAAGTLKADARTPQNILSYGTTFAGTAAAYGTLVGSAAVGAGTSTWVSSISVTNPAGTATCLVGFGTALNGTSVLLKHVLGTTSAVGIQKSFPMAVNAGMTNQDLVCYVSGAATIDVNVSYFISA